jgi:hypothetical protein
LKAVCTSLAEQLAALIVCASAPKRALNRKKAINDSHFIFMVGGAPILIKIRDY